MPGRPPHPKQLVADGYSRIAEGFLRDHTSNPSPRRQTYLDETLAGLPKDAWVLDLGCGGGKPADWLSKRCRVVGVDIARRQLELARRTAPRAAFVLADMASVAFRPGSLDAIVALYSIIHLPREEHAPLFSRLFGFLRPGGRLLAVLGAREWEGMERDWLGLGADMFWSHYDAETGLALIEDADFRVVGSGIEPDTLVGGGAHLYVVAEKQA
jgi:SAM-dependent methyltransferase